MKKLILGLVFAAIAASVIIIGTRMAMGTLIDNLNNQSPAHSPIPASGHTP